jgi:hypothetical protein
MVGDREMMKQVEELLK